MITPVLEQSQILRQPAMSHAGRSWLSHGPNSGFDSRDGGHSSDRAMIFNPMSQASDLLSGGAILFALFAFYVVFAP